METLSDNIKNKLAAMAEDYVKQLPARFNEIYEYAASAKTSDNMESLSLLRNSVHKLSGSGATFGFDELSLKSKSMEKYLDPFLKKNLALGSSDWDFFNKSMAEIVIMCSNDGNHDELEELESFDQEDGNLKFEIEPHSNNCLIYLSDTEDTILSEISDQMEIFGFQIQSIHSFLEIEKLLEVDRWRILIVHASFIEDNDNLVHALWELKRTYINSLSITFIAERDDFALRLQTVRAGGDAFFILPLDTGSLVDKIGKLTSNSSYPPLHVLIVDDDREQIAYYAFVLQEAGMITSVASDPQRVIEVLIEAKPELILMDMYMPFCSGLELAAIIRQHESFMRIPIIFLSVEQDEGKHLEAMRFGADDFLMKPIQPENLIIHIKSKAVRNRNLRFLMERDSLTGLLNHVNLKERITNELLRAKRNKGKLSFVMIDADHFKLVNDNYGHLAGDMVLKSLSRLLQDRLRRTDIVGRYGGEEFGAILPNTGPDIAFKVIEEIRKNFAKVKHKSDNKEFFVTFSCGIASFPECQTPSKLNESADKAMYEAKKSGRNMTVIFSS